MIQQLQIKLNGIPITGRVDGLSDFTLNYSRDSETGRTQKSFSNDLTFYDDGFNIINPILIANNQGLNNSIRVEIWDSCCNAVVFNDLIIRGDSIDFCSGDCFVKCRVTRQDPDERIYDCLRTLELSDNRNGFFNNTPFPNIAYCDELRPQWLMITLFYIALGFLASFYGILIGLISFVATISAIVLAICGILKIIENILNSIPTINVNWTPPFCDDLLKDPFKYVKEIGGFVDKILENIIGCGRKHPSPLYRDYIQNACTICGINSFSSSILNNPNSEYYNAVYFHAPVKPGRRTPPNYIFENRPMYTVDSWLSLIAKDFNSGWWVDNGILYFERNDYYLSQAPIYDAVANAATGDILDGVCFSYNETKLYASRTVETTLDGLDETGNEAQEEYRAFLNFQQLYGYNPNWTDHEPRRLHYAPARFRNDGIEPDILSDFGTIPLVNFLAFQNLTNTGEYLLMSKSIASSPKMLIWDASKGRQTAIVKDYGANYGRNFPAKADYAPFPVQQMYDFHRIDDPMQNPFRMWSAELTVRMSCPLLQQLSVNRTVRLRTPYGAVVNARILQIQANMGQREVMFSCEF